MRFLVHALAAALGFWVASRLVHGVHVHGPVSLLLAGVVLGILNALVRPILTLLTFPLTILTLGLFLLVINAGMLSLVAWLLKGMEVAGFWPAFFGAIVVSITGWFANGFIGDHGRVEVYSRQG